MVYAKVAKFGVFKFKFEGWFFEFTMRNFVAVYAWIEDHSFFFMHVLHTCAKYMHEKWVLYYSSAQGIFGYFFVAV